MIPIDLPTWVRPAIYIFLALMALEVAIRIWQTVKTSKTQEALEEIKEQLAENQEDLNSVLAKVNIMFLMLKVAPPEYIEDDYQTDQIDRVE